MMVVKELGNWQPYLEYVNRPLPV